MNALEVLPSGPVHARLRAPASKSVTNRLLVVAALADGDSLLRDPLDSDDTRAMRAALSALGVVVTDVPDGWRVRGTGGRLRAPDAPIDARLSGTTLRFVTALATLVNGSVTVTGEAPLLRRPIAPLVDALPSLRTGRVEVDVGGSSQFASALLLIAPYAGRPIELRTIGAAATGYLDLTADLMRRWGANVTRAGDGCWRIVPGRYRARTETVAYDASAAAHLYALAAATGGEVTVLNATAHSAQPDAALPGVLQAMGCALRRSGDALTVAGPEAPIPFEGDLGAMPDQVTTIAALAALAEGTTRLTGVAVARGHETDRLAALATELGKLGVAVDERPDGLEIHGGGARGPARLATYDDHRLAMALAAVGARVPGLVITDPGCVAKTYPAFWEDLRSAGVRWEQRE